MKRLFFTSMVALLFASIWQSLGNHIPHMLNQFFLPPIILVFVLQFYRPLEMIFACLILGFITDVMGGMMIGANMLLMLLLAFLLSQFNLFSGRIAKREQIFYVMAVSLLYRLCIVFWSILFLGNKTNNTLMQILIGPIIDGFLSLVFYQFLIKVLVFFKAFEQSDLHNNRLGLHR